MHPSIHAAADPERPACIVAGSGRILTYGELEAKSNQSAHLLRSLGFKRGDVLAALSDNNADLFVLAWAAQRCGLYLTSISNKLASSEVGYILSDCGAKALVASDSQQALAAESSARAGGPPVFLFHAPLAGTPGWFEQAERQPTTRIADESAGTDMLYSSGTTGRAKGVRPPLPSGPVDAPTPLTAMGRQLYGMSGESIYLSTSPLYHSAPLRWAMTIHRLGGVCVIMEAFHAETALALIERHRITHSTWVPTHFSRLLKLPAEVRKKYDVSSMRVAIHAAAPCPVSVKRAMIDWWGPIIYEYYSGTEMCGITALDSEEWLKKPGSVGRAILGVVKIVNAQGKEAAVGEEGLVYFADGPRFAYHNDPAKTAAAHNEQGWATMGDIGRLDADGYLFLTDRASFMIISGGVNIYPQEIENVLGAHPAVADVAVIGAPDEEMGERVVAVVQPQDWGASHEALRAELSALARRELGGLKTPKQIDFRRQLPRLDTGKLMKRLLRDEYAAAARGPKG